MNHHNHKVAAGAASVCALVAAGLGVMPASATAATTTAALPTVQCAPAADYPAATTSIGFWSTEARCAIVPAGPGGVFGAENFGTKFPGEAAVYMGIVHVAIYDAAVAIGGAYQAYTSTPPAPANLCGCRGRDRDRDRDIRHLDRASAAAGREPDHPRRRLRRLHGGYPGSSRMSVGEGATR